MRKGREGSSRTSKQDVRMLATSGGHTRGSAGVLACRMSERSAVAPRRWEDRLWATRPPVPGAHLVAEKRDQAGAEGRQ